MKTLCYVALIATCAWAELSPERARLLGSWKTGNETWKFEQKDDDLHVTAVENGQDLAAFDCNTVGRECQIDWGGQKSTVSMWFNGPKLVIMQTQGNKVTKRRFSVSEQTGKMTLELMPIVPAGKPQSIELDPVGDGGSTGTTPGEHGAPAAGSSNERQH